MSEKTLVALSKNDPSIYVTIPISEDDCVGSSLSFINWNFRSIDNALSNLTFSANNYWNDAYDYINNNKDRWDELVADYEALAVEFEELLSTVEVLSGDWFTPISIVYPSATDGFTISSLSAWVNTNYQVNPYSVDDPNCYEYIEGQELYLFVMDLSGGSHVTVEKTHGLEFHVVGEGWTYIGYLPGYS